MSEEINKHNHSEHEHATAPEHAELVQAMREQHEQHIATAERQRDDNESERTYEKEALRHAQSVEHKSDQEKRHRSPAERRKDNPTKVERKQAYERLMSGAQAHMSPASKTFSNFIHNPAIEKSSDAVGATIARPNALLAGSIAAFILPLTVYLIARYYGYSLSGLETIATFLLGWVIGLMFDYFRVMATGGR